MTKKIKQEYRSKPCTQVLYIYAENTVSKYHSIIIIYNKQRQQQHRKIKERKQKKRELYNNTK